MNSGISQHDISLEEGEDNLNVRLETLRLLFHKAKDESLFPVQFGVDEIFSNVLNLHDVYFSQGSLPGMVETQDLASELLLFSIDNLLRKYILNDLNLISSYLSSSQIDISEVFLWEKPLVVSGFDSDVSQKGAYRIPEDLLSEIASLFTKTEFRAPQVNRKSIAFPQERKTDNGEENDPKAFEKVIETIRTILLQKGRLQMREYFLVSTDLESVKRLFAIFALIDEGKACLNHSLEVEYLGFQNS